MTTAAENGMTKRYQHQRSLNAAAACQSAPPHSSPPVRRFSLLPIEHTATGDRSRPTTPRLAFRGRSPSIRRRAPLMALPPCGVDQGCAVAVTALGPCRSHRLIAGNAIETVSAQSAGIGCAPVKTSSDREISGEDRCSNWKIGHGGLDVVATTGKPYQTGPMSSSSGSIARWGSRSAPFGSGAPCGNRSSEAIGAATSRRRRIVSICWRRARCPAQYSFSTSRFWAGQQQPIGEEVSCLEHHSSRSPFPRDAQDHEPLGAPAHGPSYADCWCPSAAAVQLFPELALAPNLR